MITKAWAAGDLYTSVNEAENREVKEASNGRNHIANAVYKGAPLPLRRNSSYAIVVVSLYQSLRH